ncbi:MAG: 50S ribosomal protein L10 [Candidatus Moranbacteria bacterium]|nr:50S ribosomal protein L10 [Candidatus Moranbacteria bacterium]
MLTKLQKEQLVKELKEQMDQSKVVVMANFHGLTIGDMSDLKKEIREAGGRMQVIKKTLVNIALKERGIDFDTRKFAGPLVFIFGPEETAIPRKIWGFSRKNENLKVEGGILLCLPAGRQDEIVAKSDIEALAKLPSKEELLGKIVSTIQEPVSGFVNVLAGPVRSFVQVMKAIAEK